MGVKIGGLLVNQSLVAIAIQNCTAESTTFVLTTESARQFEVEVSCVATIEDLEKYVSLSSSRLEIPFYVVARSNGTGNKYIDDLNSRLAKSRYDDLYFRSVDISRHNFDAKIDGLWLAAPLTCAKSLPDDSKVLLTGKLELRLEYSLLEYEDILSDISGYLIAHKRSLSPSNISEEVIKVGLGRYTQTMLDECMLSSFDTARTTLLPYFKLYENIHLHSK